MRTEVYLTKVEGRLLQQIESSGGVLHTAVHPRSSVVRSLIQQGLLKACPSSPGVFLLTPEARTSPGGVPS